MQWGQLAKAVVARRVELGYERREDLAEASGIGSRTLGDIERAEEKGYRASLLARLEQALQWPPGAAQAILNGAPAPEPGSRTAYTLRVAGGVISRTAENKVRIDPIGPEPSEFILARTRDRANRLLDPDGPLDSKTRLTVAAAISNILDLVERPPAEAERLRDDEAREVFGRTMASLERHRDEVGFGAAERG